MTETTSALRRGFATRAPDGDDDGPIPFVIATEGRKADGLDLQMDRLNLERYLGNPVIGYGHSYFGRDNLPIGRASDVEVDGPRLRANAHFDPDDDFAQTVERKYRSGFMNAVSVGFDLRSVDEQTGIPEEWELTEFSAVPIPLDPDALQDPRSRGYALQAALEQLREAETATDTDDVVAALERLLAPPADEPAPCPACAARDGDPTPDPASDEPDASASLDLARRRLRLAGV